jgi:hypothetical protein
MGMEYGTWNVRSLCRSGSLKTVAREIAKYMSDLVGIKKVKWDKVGTEPTDDYKFYMEVGIIIICYVQDFVHTGIIQNVLKVALPRVYSSSETLLDFI